MPTEHIPSLAMYLLVLDCHMTLSLPVTAKQNQQSTSHTKYNNGQIPIHGTRRLVGATNKTAIFSQVGSTQWEP